MPKVSHYKTDHPIDAKQKEQIDPCVKFVVDEWESYDSFWSSKFNDFEKYYDRWMGKPPKRDEDWQSNFHKRLTWQAEKVLVSRFHSNLFPTSAPIETEAVEVQDERQRILAKSITAHWFKVGKFSKEFLSGMRSAAIYGTGLFEDDWYVRKETVIEKAEKQIPDYRPLVDVNGNKIEDESGNIKVEEIGKKTILTEQSKVKIVEDRYRVRKANIFSWRVHPNKLSDEDDLPAIKQEFVTYDDLLDRQEEADKYGFAKFENMDLIEQSKSSAKEDDAKRLQKDGEYIDLKNPRIELLHFWGMYADKKNGKPLPKKPMWIVVANRKYILIKRDNPYWHQRPPLFHIIWTEDEKPSYYGIGIAQIGADAEDRANTWINIRTDIKKKNIRGTGWYNSLDKKIKKSQLTSNTPGLMRACSDVNAAVKMDNPVPTDPTDYTEEQTATNDFREITAASSSLLPTENKKNEPDTLGGMQQNLSQAVSRLKPDLSMMEIMGIRVMANRAFLLSRQFMSREETIELVASEDKLKQLGVDKIYKMTPKELIGSAHFVCTGLSESIDKNQNIDKLIKYAEMTSKIPEMRQITNYQAIAKRIALWLGFEDVDSFINPVQPVALPGSPATPGMPQLPGNQARLPQPAVNQPPRLPMPSPQPQQRGGLPPQLSALIAQRMQQAQNQGARV